MKLHPVLRRIARSDDADVAFRILAELRGVESSRMSTGYYGAVELVMRDGKRFLEVFRFHDAEDKELASVRKVAIRASKYWRDLKGK